MAVIRFEEVHPDEMRRFLDAERTPFACLRVYPSIETTSDRIVVDTAETRYALAGSYPPGRIQLADRLELGIGAHALFHEDLQLAEGPPEEGGSYFASAGARCRPVLLGRTLFRGVASRRGAGIEQDRAAPAGR